MLQVLPWIHITQYIFAGSCTPLKHAPVSAADAGSYGAAPGYRWRDGKRKLAGHAGASGLMMTRGLPSIGFIVVETPTVRVWVISLPEVFGRALLRQTTLTAPRRAAGLPYRRRRKL